MSITSFNKELASLSCFATSIASTLPVLSFAKKDNEGNEKYCNDILYT